MKKAILILFLAVFAACNTETSQKDIDNLNGYWEIQQADLPEGISKQFTFSEWVDYIEINDSTGVRTKVRPQLDGSFIASEDAEKFTVKVENDSLNLYYKTPYAQWKETVLSSEEDKFETINKDGIIYTYTRFTPYPDNYGEEN